MVDGVRLPKDGADEGRVWKRHGGLKVESSTENDCPKKVTVIDKTELRSKCLMANGGH